MIVECLFVVVVVLAKCDGCHHGMVMCFCLDN